MANLTLTSGPTSDCSTWIPLLEKIPQVCFFCCPQSQLLFTLSSFPFFIAHNTADEGELWSMVPYKQGFVYVSNHLHILQKGGILGWKNQRLDRLAFPCNQYQCPASPLAAQHIMGKREADSLFFFYHTFYIPIVGDEFLVIVNLSNLTQVNIVTGRVVTLPLVYDETYPFSDIQVIPEANLVLVYAPFYSGKKRRNQNQPSDKIHFLSIDARGLLHFNQTRFMPKTSSPPSLFGLAPIPNVTDRVNCIANLYSQRMQRCSLDLNSLKVSLIGNEFPTSAATYGGITYSPDRLSAFLLANRDPAFLLEFDSTTFELTRNVTLRDSLPDAGAAFGVADI